MAKFNQLPHGFDLKAIQVFVITADQGGMTQSAKILGMTQSGVSQTIAALEETVGRQLFDRTVRPIALTSAGRSLYGHGRSIIANVYKAYNEASDLDSGTLASLTIAMPESMANVVGPHLYNRSPELAKFWRIWSGLTPDQHNLFNTHAVDMMITDEVNITTKIDIESHEIVTEPYVLIFPRNFPLPMELGPHLADSNLIRYSIRSSAGRHTEAQLNRLKLDFPSHIEFDTASCQATAVAGGLGWGITTPICLLQRPSLLDDLVVKPINRGSFSRKLVLIARHSTFGEAPLRVANECRAILEESIVPSLRELLPWLEGFAVNG